MVTIKVEKGFNIDPNAGRTMSKRIQAHVNAAFREGVRSFIDGMLERISVDSGMSGATLLPLAGGVLHRRWVATAIASGKKKKGRLDFYGKFGTNNGPWRSRSLGAKVGGRGYSITKLQDNNWSGEFLFRITAFQHFYHESSGNTKGSRKEPSHNWQSIEHGTNEFTKTYHAELDRRLSQGDILEMLLNGN